ncbi:MAG TPA: phytanoyl-CoA dioxygenase family protein [Acidimicrobiales bacterium]|nr:phytanoyl-CoA dioxygenase family protein [Acidimicrobiales bacterium]
MELTVADHGHFRDRGWVRVPGAFSGDDAAAMRDVVWRALEKRGVRRDDPSTWTDEAPTHLQGLKGAPQFGAVGTPRTLGAITEVLGTDAWPRPRDWGAFFLLFPTARPWNVPHAGWHVDAPYRDRLEPPAGLKVHALFGDVEPRAGGMTVIEGSHRVVAHVMSTSPPAANTSAARIRKHLMASDPWLKELATPGDPDARIAQFADTSTDVFGVDVRVVEMTGQPGDVILMHPLLLHIRPTNAGSQPRFLVNKDLRVTAQ